MTDEHLWLQGALREICRELGYGAELEVDYAGARVDLRVESSPPFAFEVQRVSTDFGQRRKARAKNGMQTLWLLPESDRQKDTGKGKKRRDPLFSEPCVRLGYRDGPGRNAKVLSVDELRSTVWQGDGSAEVYLRAGVTVGKLSDDHMSFYSSWLPLKTFLQQVLEGGRQWFPYEPAIQGRNGSAWAGWLLTKDVTRYEAAVQAARDERRRREEVEREAAAEAEAYRKAEQERIAREKQEAIEHEKRARERQAEIELAAEEEKRVETGRRVDATAEAGRPGDAAPVGRPESKAVRDPWWRRLWHALVG